MSEQKDIPGQDLQTEQPDRSEDHQSTRREMIQKYAKYAVASAPFLLFVSKAHAIHSKP